jgi:hypothetical protein
MPLFALHTNLNESLAKAAVVEHYKSITVQWSESEI